MAPEDEDGELDQTQRLKNKLCYDNPTLTELVPVDLRHFGESVSQNFSSTPHGYDGIMHESQCLRTPIRHYEIVNNENTCDENDTNSQTLDFSLIQNQSLIDQLDLELSSLPKDDFIKHLITICNGSEESVTFYRNVLACRARSDPGCPKGKLVTRRTTARYKSVEKYAEDCHSLYLFLHGDKTEIKDVYTKTRQ